jgi:SAM-dependent methyltransferase
MPTIFSSRIRLRVRIYVSGTEVPRYPLIYDPAIRKQWATFRLIHRGSSTERRLSVYRISYLWPSTGIADKIRDMDVTEFNRLAWDRQVERGSEWARPVSPAEVAAAKAGQWSIILTPIKHVPHDWLPPLPGLDVLCLASGGGQQGPILAAAGAKVTVFDNSPRQLEQDRLVADRENLTIRTVDGDMADLGVFADEVFDLIVHPVSNVFVPDVIPVWRESFRVLRNGGVLLAGFNNPVVHLIDYNHFAKTGRIEIKFGLPYSDLKSLSRTDGSLDGGDSGSSRSSQRDAHGEVLRASGAEQSECCSAKTPNNRTHKKFITQIVTQLHQKWDFSTRKFENGRAVD